MKNKKGIDQLICTSYYTDYFNIYVV